MNVKASAKGLNEAWVERRNKAMRPTITASLCLRLRLQLSRAGIRPV